MSISAVSELILKTIKEYMVPVLEPDQIELCAPNNLKSQTLLGVYLYNITRDGSFRVDKNIPVGKSTQATPPICLSLDYMFTVYAGGKSGALDDHRIIEKLVQVFNNRPSLPNYSIYQPNHVPATSVKLLTPTIDEISRIWQFPNTSTLLSLYYRVEPVPVGALSEKSVPRISSADFGADEKE